jgi:hypothetical protein
MLNNLYDNYQLIMKLASYLNIGIELHLLNLNYYHENKPTNSKK